MIKNPRAWIVPVKVVNGRSFFLLGLRGPTCGNPNTWGFFGGNCDAGETPEQAAARELHEETGLQVGLEYLVPLFVANLDTKKGHTKPCSWFAVPAAEFDMSTIKFTKEVVEYEWVDLSWANREDLHYSAKHFFDWCRMQGERNTQPDVQADVVFLKERGLI